MGWTYKGRRTAPGTLSHMHEKIARGLELDFKSVQAALPEARQNDAREICEQLDKIEYSSPALYNKSLIGLSAGSGVFSIVPALAFHSLSQGLAFGAASLALIGVSLYGMKTSGAAKVDKTRESLLKRMFTLSAHSHAPSDNASPPTARVPWRDEKPVQIDLDKS